MEIWVTGRCVSLVLVWAFHWFPSTEVLNFFSRLLIEMEVFFNIALLIHVTFESALFSAVVTRIFLLWEFKWKNPDRQRYTYRRSSQDWSVKHGHEFVLIFNVSVKLLKCLKRCKYYSGQFYATQWNLTKWWVICLLLSFHFLQHKILKARPINWRVLPWCSWHISASR